MADDLLYTMTAPTGVGKTLAMLLFALEKAAREPGRFRRIIVALPYLSILDQTVKIYRELFPAHEFGEHYLLEHHSLTGAESRGDETDSESSDAAAAERAQSEARLLTENWDAPIILTTNVQLFESLHASRPSACRKLHRLSGSILLCDEIQTLPPALAIPTLRTLSALARPPYDAAVVFATATQPAFTALHAEVAKDTGTGGWTPREIVADPDRMFREAAALRPVSGDWAQAKTPTPWSTVAGWLTEADQGMAIVNLRRHSLLLAQLLAERGTPGLEYISTYLCPAHRREVLGRVNAALEPGSGTPCRLVATQCVEAGVDLDFPLVCRALGPLEAIAQAGGRCNRHGIRTDGGTLRIFLPEDDAYPDDGYAQAAQMAASLIRGETGPNLADPAVFARYFQTLYALNDLAKKETEVRKAIKELDFVETAKEYRLIDRRGINVVVPYKGGAQIGAEILREGLNRARIRTAREYTVSVFTNARTGPPAGLKPVSIAFTGKDAPDWFVLTDPAQYDAVFGYVPKETDKEGGATVRRPAPALILFEDGNYDL
jgi:hypothetical protein